MWVQGNASNGSGVDVVFVLGMHRSGTSALARAMQALGLDLGENHLPAVENDNDRGYWEDKEAQDLCENALAFLGSRWNSLTPILPSDIERLCGSQLFSDACDLLTAKRAAGRPIALKNPRLCKLAPFWTSVTHQLGLQTAFVIAVRNPLSVAYSLTRNGLRGDIPPFVGLNLWLSHSAEAVVATRNYPRVFVDYDLLLGGPEAQLNRVADHLGLQRPAPELAHEFAEQFLTQELRHSKFTLAELDGAHDVSKDVKRAYALLLDASLAAPGATIPTEMGMYFDLICDQAERARQSLEHIDARELVLSRLQTKVHELELHIRTLDSTEASGAKVRDVAGPTLQGLQERIEELGALQGRLVNLLVGSDIPSASPSLMGLVSQTGADLGASIRGFDAHFADVGARLHSLGGSLSELATRLPGESDALGLQTARSLLETGIQEIAAAIVQARDSISGQLAASSAPVVDEVRALLGNGVLEITGSISRAGVGLSNEVAERTASLAHELSQSVNRGSESLVETLKQAETTVTGHIERTGELVLTGIEQARQLYASIESQIANKQEDARQSTEQALAAATSRVDALVRTASEEFRPVVEEIRSSTALVVPSLQSVIALVHAELAGRLATLSTSAELQGLVDGLSGAVQQLNAGITAEIAQRTESALAQFHDWTLSQEHQIERLRAEHAEALVQERLRADAEIGRHKSQMAEIVALKQGELAQLQRSGDELLEQERTRTADLLQRADLEANGLRMAYAELQARYGTEIDAARDHFDTQLAVLRRQYDATLMATEARLAEQRSAFEARLQDQDKLLAQRIAAHARAVQALQENHAEMLRERSAEIQEQNRLFERRVDEMAQNHLAELSVVKEMAAAAARQIEQDRDQRLEQARHEAHLQSLADQKTIGELNGTLDNMRKWKGLNLVAWWNNAH